MSNGGSGNAVVVFAETQRDCGNAMMGLGVRNVEVVGKVDGLYTVSELEARSLSSRNTLGDTTHNINKIGLSWDGGRVWWASLCEVMVVVDEEAIVPK